MDLLAMIMSDTGLREWVTVFDQTLRSGARPKCRLIGAPNLHLLHEENSRSTVFAPPVLSLQRLKRRKMEEIF
jgi:hypothetical protein